MKRLTVVSPERPAIPCDEVAIEAALLELFPYGGEDLGFTVDTATLFGKAPRYTNKVIGLLVARAVSRITGRKFDAVSESTRDFQGHTEEHCDGLNIEDYFLQIHTLHPSNRGVSSEAYLRAYNLSETGRRYLLDLATDALDSSGSGIDGSIEIFPPHQKEALKDANLTRLERIGQASLETLVFVNGFPGNDLLTQPKTYLTHEFFSRMNGFRSSALRTATFSRVETKPPVRGTVFSHRPLPPAS